MFLTKINVWKKSSMFLVFLETKLFFFGSDCLLWCHLLLAKNRPPKGGYKPICANLVTPPPSPKQAGTEVGRAGTASTSSTPNPSPGTEGGQARCGDSRLTPESSKVRAIPFSWCLLPGWTGRDRTLQYHEPGTRNRGRLGWYP